MMNFRGRDSGVGGNLNKMDMEPRRFAGGMDDKQLDDPDDRRFDSGRGGRRPPFGRGRRLSPIGRDRPRDYGGFGGRDDPPMMRDRSPMRGPDDRFSDRYKKDDGFSKRDDGRKDMGRPFYGEDRDRYMEGRSRMDDSGRNNSRFDGPIDPFKPRGGAGAMPGAKGFVNDGFPKPNECEVIAVNKQQRYYAESVEVRVKDMGLLVDVLFLKDEALLTQTIDDIARRGSLYAIVISPQNESHGSVTVNILHGTPQEHRNMPLEDALKLVSRNFHDYIRGQRERMERERVERGQYDGGVSADREMQFLLRMLADGRWITLPEITTVIRYLSERRDKMQAAAGGLSSTEDRGIRRPPLPSVDTKLDTPFKPSDDLDVAKKEQDLQNRIMNIMNQGAPQQSLESSSSIGGGLDSSIRGNQSGLSDLRPPSSTGSNIPGLQSEDSFLKQTGSGRGDPDTKPDFSSTGAKSSGDASASTPSFLNFNNPSVQKALDNLMQSGPNLLKNISLSSGPNLPNSAQTNTLTGNSPTTNVGGSLGSSDPLGMQRGMAQPRGPGRMSDISVGQTRGSGNMDISVGQTRGSGNMDISVGQTRGSGNMDISPPRLDMGSQRGLSGSDMMGGGPPRSRFGGMSDMGAMSRGYGGGNTMPPDSSSMNQRQQRGPVGSLQGNQFGGNQFGPGSNQFGKFQGQGGQQGNYAESYNNSGMGNMPRQNFGGNQGMGGGPRRY